MSGWSFLRSRRWLGFLAFTILVAVVCSALGWWQLARRAEALTEVARVEANFDAPPLPLAEALPTLDSYSEDQKWRTVEMTGRYLPEEQVLVRNRPFHGTPGFHVLTPLRLDDGTVFVVDRGWVPTGSRQDAPDAVPGAPGGEVRVIARLRAGEPTLPGRQSTDRQLATIQLDEMAERVGGRVYVGAYGLLVEEDPASAERPLATPRPERDEGPHLSYALQWFVFAVLAFVALGWAARQEYRIVNADDPDEQDRSARREDRKRSRAPSDAEIEDEILDAAR